MKKTLVSLIGAILISSCLFSSSSFLGGDSTSVSSVLYDLNECSAFVNAGTVADYSEFTGVANNNPECSMLTPLSNIFRENPTVNKHSCTPGVNQSMAMCVNSLDQCSFEADNERAIRFDIMVTPGPSGSGNLSGLSFYEQAPENYNWVAGPAGLNNYPTKYALRILKDSVEIFVSAELETTTGWTLEEFDFSGNPAFTVNQPTIFSFEMLAYCLVGNNATVSAWDIDEVLVTSTCTGGSIEGGDLAISTGGTSLSICANDGISDAFDVVLTGATGSQSAWVITDESGNILALPAGPPFDLEGAGTGTCLVWHLSYDGPITGLIQGSNANDLQGCFALSNPIVVARNMQSNAVISTSGGAVDISICAGDGVADPIDVTLQGSTSPNNQWVITDEAGVILELPTGPPFDFESAGFGVCLIWNIGYEGTLSNLEVGQNAADLEGCFGLSNSIRVTRTQASAGTITSNGQTVFDICAGDGVADPIDVQLTGNLGQFGQWIITNEDGIITDLPTGPPFNLDGAVSGTCLIWHLSYDGAITGLGLGMNALNLQGCFGLSNSITVNKMRTSGGVLSYNNFTFLQPCGNDPLLSSLQPSLNNNMGANLSWILTDNDGNVIQFLPSPPFDLTALSSDRFRIYALSYDGPDPGIDVGMNVEILATECAGLSNPLIIAKENAIGGTISSSMGDVIDICIDGNSLDNIDISLTGAEGDFSRWIVTDTNNNIVALPGAPPFSIDFLGLPTCYVYHLSYEPSFTGLVLGNNTSNFTGCFELSNRITLNKQSANGGVISTLQNTSTFDICDTGNGANSQLDVVLNNQEGQNFAWVITDVDGNILQLPMGPPFDFSVFADGDYRVWHLAFNGSLMGAAIGQNAADLSGDCFSLSNFIAVNKSTALGGTISSPFGDNFTICAGDGSSDIVDVSVMGQVGNSTSWLITDAQGNILSLPGQPPFNLDDNTGQTCLIWHLSYNDISGLTVGSNANNLTGCFGLSNPITVNKSDVSGGTISSSLGDNITTCVDGINDNIDVTLVDADGSNNQWVVTDVNGNILALPTAPPFDFDAAGVGTCLIWNLSYETIDGLQPGNNVSQVTGCFSLSNSITVNRTEKDAGDISLADGSTEYTICAGDAIPDPLDVFVSGGDTIGNIGWVITDQDANILALPANPPFDLESAGVGTCLIWRACFNDGTTGIEVGLNAADIAGCFDLSNPITVTRLTFEGAGESNSTATFDLEACYSDTQDNSNKDYSEFTSVVNNANGCSVLSTTNIFRENPNENMHSCTAGVNGSVAMCVGSLDSCDFLDDDEKAIRFSVTVDPNGNGTANLSSLSFYEQAPPTYQWNNGPSGINNPPSFYGVRVSVAGAEIYKATGIATSPDWTLESFDFSGESAFMVSGVTTFDFELLGYCTVDNGSTVNAWDIDNVVVTSSCSTGLSPAVIATQSDTTGVVICAGDGMDDIVTPVVIGGSGQNAAWVITDESANILELPSGPSFNFEDAGEGVCLIWYLTFSDGLVGAEVGANAADLQGCYMLSNPITVTRLTGLDCTTNANDPEDPQSALMEDYDVMPNPAVDKLSIVTDNEPTVGTRLLVYDRMGKIIEDMPISNKTTDILLNDYANGFYYIKIYSGKRYSVQSFIKM